MFSSRYQVWMNGRNLRDISESLIVTDVSENAPAEKDETAAGYSDGTRLLRTVRSKLTVTVGVVIAEKSLAQRSGVYDRLCGWAETGGWLETNDRFGQRLWIDRVSLPSLGSVKKWETELKIVLTAYAKPFFESSHRASVSVSTAAVSGSGTLIPAGNEKQCTCDASITAAGGTVNALTVTAGNSSMTFAALGLTAGGTLTIGHDESGFLTLKIGDASVLSKRTAGSADELLVAPGKLNGVSFSADATCTALFASYGRWR